MSLKAITSAYAKISVEFLVKQSVIRPLVAHLDPIHWGRANCIQLYVILKKNFSSLKYIFLM